ncbi:MAG: response regulator [Saprospiraceae bacterium]|nr:response regulator [Saprospiraceae bacterium]
MNILEQNTAKVKQPLNILLVEDNPINVKLAMINLQKLGHKIDVANNGQIAVNKYKEKVYDLILMDIEMPIMDGIQATKLIREIENQINPDSKVRIIAMTAHDAGQRNEFLGMGIDNFYSKPIRASTFTDIFT